MACICRNTECKNASKRVPDNHKLKGYIRLPKISPETYKVGEKKEKELFSRKRWLEHLKKKEDDLGKHPRVCKIHFYEDDFDDNGKIIMWRMGVHTDLQDDLFRGEEDIWTLTAPRRPWHEIKALFKDEIVENGGQKRGLVDDGNLMQRHAKMARGKHGKLSPQGSASMQEHYEQVIEMLENKVRRLEKELEEQKRLNLGLHPPPPPPPVPRISQQNVSQEEEEDVDAEDEEDEGNGPAHGSRRNDTVPEAVDGGGGDHDGDGTSPAAGGNGEDGGDQEVVEEEEVDHHENTHPLPDDDLHQYHHHHHHDHHHHHHHPPPSHQHHHEIHHVDQEELEEVGHPHQDDLSETAEVETV